MTEVPFIKIGLISSQGGHMKQMKLLKKCYKEYPHFLITVRNQKEIKTRVLDCKQYFMTNIGEGRWNKSFFSFLKSFWEIYTIYRHEKPDLIISTGCGITAPGFIIAKWMKIKTIYVEPGARVCTLSKTGRICYSLCDLFFIQHPLLARKYPKAVYKGILYKYLSD